VPRKKPSKHALNTPLAKIPEVLDVRMTAELLTVSIDTVYDLFKKGELPGRKVGRKWITTKTAILRWLVQSSEHDTLARAIEHGNNHALTAALTSGKAQLKKSQ
jgi:excisionase family DNA binding protein